MIIEKNGRFRSVRTPEERKGSVEEDLSSLTPDELDALKLIMKELRSGEKPKEGSNLIEVIGNAEYKTTPVDVETFVYDEHFLGKSCDNLYPILAKDLEEIFTGGYHECIFSGSIGLDSIIQEVDGGLPTLEERLGRAGDVATLMEYGQDFSTTEPAHHSGYKKAMRLTLANGMRLDLTPDHEVLVWREGYVWVRSEDLVSDDLVIVARKIRTKPSSNLTSDEAKLLAYWVADGSSSDTRARFCDGNPETSLEVVELLRRLGFDGRRSAKGENCWEVSVSSAKKSGFLDFLARNDADLKTADVVAPSSVCKSSDDVLALFLNRLWACEGTVYAPDSAKSPPRFVLSMISERFVRQVQLLLLRFGIQSRIREVLYEDKRDGSKRKIWSLVISGIGPLKVFLDSIGDILGKEESCSRIRAYCESKNSNTNVDTLPITWGCLSELMVASGIQRSAGNSWWRLSTQKGRRVSRKKFYDWLKDYSDTDLAGLLTSLFSEDIAFEKVHSLEPVLVDIPVGDIGAHQGNRFVANGVSVHNSIGWGKCIDPETEIYDLEKGRRLAGDVNDSWLVTSMNPDGVFEPSKAKSFDSGEKDCVRLSLKGGQKIVLSHDHPVFTSRGWVKASEITDKDLVATPRRLPEPSKNLIVSDDEVKLVAYLLAEGSCTGNTKFTNSDERILGEFTEVALRCGDTSKYDPYHRHLKPKVSEAKSTNSGKAKTLQISGLKDFVRNYKLDCLAKHKRLPSSFYLLSERHVALLLNRFWACDGHIETKNTWTLECTLASEGLIDDLRFLMLRLGVHSRKYYVPKTLKGESFDAWKLKVSGSDSVLAFFEKIGPVFSKELQSSLALERARKTRTNTNVDVVPIGLKELREIRKELGNKGSRLLTDFGCPDGQLISRSKFERLVRDRGYGERYSWLARSDLFWERVESLEGVGKRRVVDLSVPGNYNFVANNIVVHNTFLASIGICRLLYEISCLKDPHRSFGLAKDSNISLVCLSVNEVLAMKVVFESIATKLRVSPYFQDNFPFQPTKKDMRFPGSLWLAARATTDSSVLGLNVLGGIIDESNFMPVRKSGPAGLGQPESQAERLYNGLKRRMKSRFERRGKLPGLMFIVSSKTTNDDFTSKLLRRSKDDPTVFVRDYAIWHVKPEAYFEGGKFWVLVGNEQTPSKILSEEEEKKFRADLPDGCVLVDVPEDFRIDFERDLEGCFTGDTKISLLDGREVPIRDLVGEDHFWVYSFCSCGRMFPGRGCDARLTKKNARIVEVELDNGERIRCTPNHRFMLRDGSYREAGSLKNGDSLMPLYRRVDKYGYELFKSNLGGKWVHTHRIVARECYSNGESLEEDLVVHHGKGNRRFFDKRDNSPCNLSIISKEDHNTLHKSFLGETLHSDTSKLKAAKARKKKLDTDPAYRSKVLASLEKARKAWDAEKHREVASESGKRYGFGRKDPTPAMVATRSAAGTANITKLNYSDRNPSKKIKNRLAASVRQKNRPKELSSEIAARGRHSRWGHTGSFEDCGICQGNVTPEYKIKKPDHPSSKGGRVGCHNRWHSGPFESCSVCNPTNHKVVSVREAGTEDVYDISVDTYHNFSLSSGVVVHNSIRDLAGISTVSVSPYISRREKIHAAVDPARRHPLEDLHWSTSAPIRFRWEEMVVEYKTKLYSENTVLRPLINPQASRVIHIDPSISKDATGFCMSHVAGFKNVERKAADGGTYLERAPVYMVDLILKIVPPTGEEILLSEVRSLVYSLASKGYVITSITLDSYQSVDTIQQLSKKGFNTSILSVDRTIDPYESLKNALYEDRVIYYEYEPLLDELKSLELDMSKPYKPKVDHPPGGSKDLSDALAGCIYTLSQMRLDTHVPFVKTSDSNMNFEADGAGRSSPSDSGVLVPFLTSNSGPGDWGSGWNPDSL